MTAAQLHARFDELCKEDLPLPGAGATAHRHLRLMAIAREDLSLAKLAEAHWDAIAILSEAGREPEPGVRYAVWASEAPGRALSMDASGEDFLLNGVKQFCSGAGLVDRALITAGPDGHTLVEIDLRSAPEGTLHIDGARWATAAFRDTCTSAIAFTNLPISVGNVVAKDDWYASRAGLWNGACGPVACWVGGAAGLLEYAQGSRRDDAHTLAHIGAMGANQWAMESLLKIAGDEIDAAPTDTAAARARALRVRHLVVGFCNDTLQRFGRALGPFPVAMDAAISRRVAELGLFLLQSHAERDLEQLERSRRGL